MNKELIQRMLTNSQIQMNDLTIFITEYTEFKLKRVISTSELQGIIQLIQMNIFNLRYALIEAGRLLNLNILSTYDKNGILLRTDVYE